MLWRSCRVVRRKAEPSTLDLLRACDPDWDKAKEAA
jgi:hypothetical protein